jgi:hypothetical protein
MQRLACSYTAEVAVPLLAPQSLREALWVPDKPVWRAVINTELASVRSIECESRVTCRKARERYPVSLGAMANATADSRRDWWQVAIAAPTAKRQGHVRNASLLRGRERGAEPESGIRRAREDKAPRRCCRCP